MKIVIINIIIILLSSCVRKSSRSDQVIIEEGALHIKDYKEEGSNLEPSPVNSEVLDEKVDSMILSDFPRSKVIYMQHHHPINEVSLNSENVIYSDSTRLYLDSNVVISQVIYVAKKDTLKLVVEHKLNSHNSDSYYITNPKKYSFD